MTIRLHQNVCDNIIRLTLIRLTAEYGAWWKRKAFFMLSFISRFSIVRLDFIKRLLTIATKGTQGPEYLNLCDILFNSVFNLEIQPRCFSFFQLPSFSDLRTPPTAFSDLPLWETCRTFSSLSLGVQILFKYQTVPVSPINFHQSIKGHKYETAQSHRFSYFIFVLLTEKDRRCLTFGLEAFIDKKNL